MLNRAHYLERQAEKAARKGRIEEAIQLHKEAADILRDLLQSVIDDKVRESVRLQAELHDKEKKVLRQQRKRCQKVSKELENLKMNHEKHSGAAGHRSSKPKKPSATSAATMASQYSEQDLQSSIYRRFQETQNLLDQLRIQDDFSTASDCTVTPSGCGTESYAATGAIPRGHRQDLANPPPVPPHQTQQTVKKPKDDKVIIEELTTANNHLRKMVDTLFFELSACQEENAHLKARIRGLEQEKGYGSPKTRRNRHSPHRKEYRSAARTEEEDANEEERSDGGYLGMQKIVPTEELPPLPPLDMPPAFNFGPNNVSAAVAAGTESPAPTSISTSVPATSSPSDLSSCCPPPPPPLKYVAVPQPPQGTGGNQ